jgi:hypothetical protein
MENHDESADRGQDDQGLKEAPRLAERYARHRTTGPFLIASLVVVATFVGIHAVLYLVGPYIKGHDQAIIGLILGGMVVVVVAVTLLVGGGKFPRRWGQKLYDRDGQVRERPRPSLVPRWLFVLVAVAAGTCLAGQIILSRLGYLSTRYSQPISATYAVPFMIILGLWRKTPATSSMMALWPALYAVHAILVATDAPFFRSIDGGTHMFIATFGYGAVIGLLAYVDSRLALRKLRRLMHPKRTNVEP